jgi:hypothetical protein
MEGRFQKGSGSKPEPYGLFTGAVQLENRSTVESATAVSRAVEIPLAAELLRNLQLRNCAVVVVIYPNIGTIERDSDRGVSDCEFSQ